MRQSHIVYFYHYAKSRDMTSCCHAFSRAFVLLIFGQKVEAKVTVLQVFKTAKIEEKVRTFMKLLGP